MTICPARLTPTGARSSSNEKMNKKHLIEVEKLERRLVAPAVRASREELDRLLADDFVEFGRSGQVWMKKEIISELLAAPGPQIEIASVSSRFVGEDVILVTYQSRRPMETDSKETLRSSIWRQKDGEWRMIFHQGTKA